MGFLTFALLLPQASETYCGTEFPRFRRLILGYRKGMMEAVLRFSLIVRILL